MGGVLLIYFASVPLLGLNVAFHFYLMLWITMASAFNVASGFAGYMPFGYVAFYGIGAFTTAILVKKAAFPLFLALPLSGVAGIVLALLFAPTLRLSGIYFGIVSLALAGICRLVITNMPEEITGGSFGLQLGSRAHPVQSFYVMMAVMVLALATILWLSRSRLWQGAARHPRRCRRGRDDGRQCPDRAPLRLADRGVLPGGLRWRRSLVHQRRRHRDRLQHPDHGQDGDQRRRRRAGAPSPARSSAPWPWSGSTS